MHVEVCYTPELIHQFDLKDKTVVIIDVLRATSCMVAGMGSGVASICPVASVEECQTLGKQGFAMAGERNGQKVEGFDLGNSPLEYQEAKWQGKHIATTTTNGTHAIACAAESQEIVIAALLNLDAVVDYLRKQNQNIVLFCAGWKGKYNIEDSLCAGAIANGLSDMITHTSDATQAAIYLYQACETKLAEVIAQSDHAQRLSGFGIADDVAYCAQRNVFDVVPVLQNGELRPL